MIIDPKSLGPTAHHGSQGCEEGHQEGHQEGDQAEGGEEVRCEEVHEEEGRQEGVAEEVSGLRKPLSFLSSLSTHPPKESFDSTNTS